jgi:hypothetical protein
LILKKRGNGTGPEKLSDITIYETWIAEEKIKLRKSLVQRIKHVYGAAIWFLNKSKCLLLRIGAGADVYQGLLSMHEAEIKTV